MEENSSTKMSRFCRQWLLKIRICRHNSAYLSDSGKVPTNVEMPSTQVALTYKK